MNNLSRIYESVENDVYKFSLTLESDENLLIDDHLLNSIFSFKVWLRNYFYDIEDSKDDN